MEKRGAIELSITTIVVVVIGITLLVLGLIFVSGIFSDITEQQKKLGEYTDEQIRDIFEQSDQYLNLPTTDFSVKMGETFNLDLVAKNQAEGVDMCTFELNLITTALAGIDPKNWFSLTPYDLNENFNVIKATPLKIRAAIKPLRTNAQLGDYLMTFQLKSAGNCNIYTAGAVIDQQPVTIRVVS